MSSNEKRMKNLKMTNVVLFLVLSLISSFLIIHFHCSDPGLPRRFALATILATTDEKH